MTALALVLSGLLMAPQPGDELSWVAVTGPKLPGEVQKSLRLAPDGDSLKLPNGWRVVRDRTLVLALDEDALGIAEIRSKIALMQWLQGAKPEHGRTFALGELPRDVQEQLQKQAAGMGAWASAFLKERGPSLKVQSVSTPVLQLSDGIRQASFALPDSGPESAASLVSGANAMPTEAEEERCQAAAAREVKEPEPVSFHFSHAFAGAARQADGLRIASRLIEEAVKEVLDERDRHLRALAERAANDGAGATDGARVGKPLQDRELMPGMHMALYGENPGVFGSHRQAAAFLRSAQVDEVLRVPTLRIVIATTPTIGPNVPYRTLVFRP
ncbi:MAG TPA: hypothetical protein VGE01_01855 [Fimbriimonas sp.]